MRPYAAMTCQELPLIQREIMQFLVSEVDVYNISLNKIFSWNFFSPKDALLASPSLQGWFKKSNLMLRDIAVTVCRGPQGLVKHRDAPPVVAKVNIPIANTQGSYNLWWDDDDNLIARHEMLTPIAFNASMNHGVEMTEACTYPRIVLSCMFFKEPLYLLED